MLKYSLICSVGCWCYVLFSINLWFVCFYKNNDKTEGDSIYSKSLCLTSWNQTLLSLVLESYWNNYQNWWQLIVCWLINWLINLLSQHHFTHFNTVTHKETRQQNILSKIKTHTHLHKEITVHSGRSVTLDSRLYWLLNKSSWIWEYAEAQLAWQQHTGWYFVMFWW